MISDLEIYQKAEEFKSNVKLFPFHNISFQAGAKWVREEYEAKLRWIPVEEQLPPIGVELLVKERFNEHEIYVFNSSKDRLIKCQDNCITAWRFIL